MCGRRVWAPKHMAGGLGLTQWALMVVLRGLVWPGAILQNPDDQEGCKVIHACRHLQLPLAPNYANVPALSLLHGSIKPENKETTSPGNGETWLTLLFSLALGKCVVTMLPLTDCEWGPRGAQPWATVGCCDKRIQNTFTGEWVARTYTDPPCNGTDQN